MDKFECNVEKPFWYDGKFVNEVGFCEDFLRQHPMVRVGGSFFTKDGRITDEESVRKEIYEIPSNLNEFTANQKFHHTAKLVC